MKAAYMGLAILTLYLTYCKFRTEQSKRADSFKYAETFVIFSGLLALLFNYRLDVLEVSILRNTF